MTTDEAKPRFTAEEKKVLAFTGAAHGLTHYVELTYPTLAVIYAVEIGRPLEEVLGWSLVGYMLLGFGARCGRTAARLVPMASAGRAGAEA